MKIGIIAPYREMVVDIEKLQQRTDIELIVQEATYVQALEEAKKMEAQGVDIIISRGATRAYIEQRCSLPVINCNYGVIDLIYALREARKFGRRIGVVTFSPHEWMHDVLEDLFQIELFFFSGYQNQQENLSYVLELKNQGVNVIVGGIISVRYAEENGLPGILVQTRTETMEQSIDEAIRVVRVLEKERNILERVANILNYVSDSVILINHDGDILLMNPGARAITRELSGLENVTSIYQLFSTPDFIKDFRERTRRSGEVVTIGSTPVVMTQQPIDLGGDETGMAIFLQDTARIQSLEYRIRKHISDKGYTARHTLNDFLGESPKALSCKAIAEYYAKFDSTVLLTGESGTGKEILAQSIHNLSLRSKGPFVAVNCSALTTTLLESELFGYGEGAFTGAKRGGRIGLFEQAHGGTIFLDEMGSISSDLQAHLLRVLQEKEIRRIGTDKVIPIDVRVIAATNSDLRAKVVAGDFRLDLYYRLCVLDMEVPPLRERREDILLIADACCISLGKSPSILPVATRQKMKEHNWPGNARELRNFVEKVCLLSPHIPPDKLLDSCIRTSAELYQPAQISLSAKTPTVTIQQGTLEEMEEELLQQLYERCGRNKTMLANQLGISRVTVWNKLGKIMDESD